MKWRFWTWLFVGVDDSPSGIRRMLDRWIFVHLAVAYGLNELITEDIDKIATTVLLPLSSIFIGLSFAWSGNAQALMQSQEIEDLSSFLPGGIAKYAYTYQLAILVILTTLCFWGLAAMGVFKNNIFEGDLLQKTIEIGLYFTASLALRECWHVILGSQAMLITRHRLRRDRDKYNSD